MPFRCHKKVIILHLLIKATVLIFLFTQNFMTTALIESPSAALGLFFMLTSLDIIYREVFSYLLSEVGSKGIDFIMLKLKQSNNNFITEEKEVHTNTY